MKIPTVYAEGYEKAQLTEPELAKKFIAHTTIGDPLAENLFSEIENIGNHEVERFIKLGLKKETACEIRNAPRSIREFFQFCSDVPSWVDFESHQLGCRMFHRNTRLILASFVAGVLVEGFATMIAKSFFITGRLRDQGVRRLKQNNRHMLEIFMPNGMRMYNDGWAHSIRIRLVHSRVRSLISNSSEWYQDEWGLPISSANLGFAVASFSARLIYHMRRIGATFSPEERESFLQIWRYSGYLMGIPESILFATEEEANEIFRIGNVCEPDPTIESVVLTHSLINSAPLFAGQTEPKDRQKMADEIKTICRAMIGDEIADKLQIDSNSKFGLLWKFKWLYRLENLLIKSKLVRSNENNNNILTILNVSAFDKDGISYKLPNHIYSESSSNW